MTEEKNEQLKAYLKNLTDKEKALLRNMVSKINELENKPEKKKKKKTSKKK